MNQMNKFASEKIVVQFGARSVKGYLDSPIWNRIEELLSNAPPYPPENFRLRRLDSNAIEDISLKEAKAVFYVHSFEGDAQHKNLNFHTLVPTVHGIWMRFQFFDGEIMEGIVFNSIRYLVDPGFFILPTDPDSNNKLVYVVKKSLVDHRVLGLRKIPQPLVPLSNYRGENETILDHIPAGESQRLHLGTRGAKKLELK